MHIITRSDMCSAEIWLLRAHTPLHPSAHVSQNGAASHVHILYVRSLYGTSHTQYTYTIHIHNTYTQYIYKIHMTHTRGGACVEGLHLSDSSNFKFQDSALLRGTSTSTHDTGIDEAPVIRF